MLTIGPASISRTFTPRSASTLVTVPPPAPDPMITTSWTIERGATCGMQLLDWSDQLRDYSATVLRHRGVAIALVGLALAGIALAVSDSLNDAAMEPAFLIGGLIAIAGLGVAGYDY